MRGPVVLSSEAELSDRFEQALARVAVDAGGRNLLEAEAVTDCLVRGSHVRVTLLLPAGARSLEDIAADIRRLCLEIPGMERVEVLQAPVASAAPSSHSVPRAAPESGTNGATAEQAGPRRPQRRLYLQEYEWVVAVASGKGGVGKSTVAVNLATALARAGRKVSLFDADIYGPSLPLMMGLREAKPGFREQRLQPIEQHGLHMLSIGNIVDSAAATIWRGPIVHQAIEQLLRDTDWPGGEVMLIDMPPGTGDAQLSISQLTPLAGAVIVSTPQDVAMLDALKGASMFQKVEVPILGLVENMSGFVCPHCQQETPIFDRDTVAKAAGQHGLPFLGRVPLELQVRLGGDSGKPVVLSHPDGAAGQAFDVLAEKLLAALAKV